jgi:meso-butanediol dehydrogenase / (S,S)-butanediol dehydrogenase / diacetyl reductase
VNSEQIKQLEKELWEAADNLRGAFLCKQTEVALMRKKKYGRIINTASIAGKVGFPTCPTLVLQNLA